MKRGDAGKEQREAASVLADHLHGGYADHPILGTGKCIIVRTVAFHYVGEVVYATPTEIMMRKVTWIADTGSSDDDQAARRWGATLANGFCGSAELECYPPDMLVLLEREAGSEVTQWPHALPTKSQ